MKTANVFLLAACLMQAGSLMQAQSPYIHKVYDYMPAPGQFINELPEYTPGDTREDMALKAEEAIANNNQGMISLGGYGGYAVFGFDHEVENKPGRYDFKILANAFYANANPNGDASKEGGSCEPGIVMVARDDNGNGLPDDPWYELAGSEYHRPQTIKGYRITYYKPDEAKDRVPHPTYPYLNDMEYIPWTTNGYGSGYLYRNTFHHQPYYPQWIDDESITFEGTRLADNYVDESGVGTYYVQYAYHWGYADNQPNTDNRSNFSIEWAVDAGGNPVSLPGIRFVKVYTGVNQYCGWLGETSTEILGAEDLHLTGGDAETPVFVDGISLNRATLSLAAGETAALSATLSPANATNRNITWRSAAPAIATVSATGQVTALSAGTALIQAISNDGYHIAACNVTVRGAAPGESVTGVALNYTQMEMHPGEVAALQAIISPEGAVNKAVSWTSSNTDVAEITVSGVLIAFAPGTTLITVRTNDGGHTATCTLTVSPAAVSSEAAAAVQAAQALYAPGWLCLYNLEGAACTLASISGQILQTFRAASPACRLPAHLPPGIYILRAQKQGVAQSFKIIVR
ncbi:MAG: Ig-like domain-containing protein [Tannerellaceae bacterium]|jgi:uncharacterized protein YjdB|nr:Ig-like domain-containing protein [Tannerellaceae bacterium]